MFLPIYLHLHISSKYSTSFSASYRALVVKATGLAGGKGVTVAKDTQDACSAVDSTLGSQKFSLGAADVIVVEELVEGEEVSVSVTFDSQVWYT